MRKQITFQRSYLYVNGDAPCTVGSDAVYAPLSVPKLTAVARFPKGGLMSSEESEQMLGLLKELSVYKTMDEDYGVGPKGQVETEAYEERERRRQEIRQEMHNLAAESRSGPS